MKQVDIYISGIVQGVTFRAFSKRIAKKYGLFGFAENLADGRLYIRALGEEESLKKFTEEVKIGPPASRVDSVEVKWGEVKERYNDFEIK